MVFFSFYIPINYSKGLTANFRSRLIQFWAPKAKKIWRKLCFRLWQNFLFAFYVDSNQKPHKARDLQHVYKNINKNSPKSWILNVVENVKACLKLQIVPLWQLISSWIKLPLLCVRNSSSAGDIQWAENDSKGVFLFTH